MGVTLADTAKSVLRNVEDTRHAAAVKKYLKSATIKDVTTIFRITRMTASRSSTLMTSATVGATR